MAYAIDRVVVWAGAIEDRPGGVAGVLAVLAQAGANLQFLIARRDKPGAGVLFVAPLTGAAQTRAARKSGLAKADSLHSLRVEGPDKAGLCAGMTSTIAGAGVNLRGVSAAALGKRCVVYFAFENQTDAKKAAQALKTTLNVR